MNANSTSTTPTHIPDNGQPVTMLEVVQHEAEGYRAWGTELGDFLARQMDQLASLIRFTSASNPSDFDDRIEVYERECQARQFDRGYQAGLDAARCEYGTHHGLCID
jgi:hypothetical protein